MMNSSSQLCCTAGRKMILIVAISKYSYNCEIYQHKNTLFIVINHANPLWD